MMHAHPDIDRVTAVFGRRKVVPRACIADGKSHIRRFLREALEDLGFIASECDEAANVPRLLSEAQPDLFLLGLSAGGIAAHAMLDTLRASAFTGKVLVFGQANAPMVAAILAIGEEMGLTMLPLLPTPFSDNDLRNRVAPLRPDEAPASPPVDVAEAIHANWLELWYQPKIETRSLTMTGAEALVRLRHPTWGVFPPASFVQSDTDPHFAALSEFVMGQAVRDWLYFVEAYGPVDLSINLPLDYFRDPQAIGILARHMPQHPAFAGLIVEMNGDDLVRDVPLARRAARDLQMHNIGISVDNLGAEWPLLMELGEFPFVEIKVDRSFVTGCGDDRLKQSTCRRILDMGDEFGARTVAEGVETRDDLIAVRDLGFDLIQGFLFAKPMEAQKFARRVLGKPLTLAN